MRSRLVPIAVLAAVLASTPLARADGDPASDELLVSDVFLPSPAPDPSASSALQAAVTAAYAHGYRLKVAVIATAADLGAIPSLFGKPTEYATFLGTEIRRLYGGPLLIVMPAGFGIYDAGRSTAAEAKVLAGVAIDASSPTALVNSAAAAAQAMLSSGALASRDITPPYVAVLPATGTRGQIARIHYYVGDDSKKATGQIRITLSGKPVATIKVPLRTVVLGTGYTATWRVPKTLRAKVLRFCLTATDPTGNRSPKSCSTLTIH